MIRELSIKFVNFIYLVDNFFIMNVCRIQKNILPLSAKKDSDHVIVYWFMTFKEYYTSEDRMSMHGVWKELFNLFIDLRDESYPHTDDEGNEWHAVELDKYLFINIVRTLYEKLNTPNSRCLVKEYFWQVSTLNSIYNGIKVLAKNNRITIYGYKMKTYDKYIIFGGLYYVLYKTQNELVEPNVVEKVKQIALHPQAGFPNYFHFFADKLNDNTDTLNALNTQTATNTTHSKKEFPFFRTDVHALSAIQNEWEKALLLPTKSAFVRYLIERSTASGHFNFDGMGHEQIAQLLNDAQTTKTITKSDVNNATRG